MAAPASMRSCSPDGIMLDTMIDDVCVRARRGGVFWCDSKSSEELEPQEKEDEVRHFENRPFVASLTLGLVRVL